MRLIDADELLEILAQNRVFFGDDNEKLSWDIIEDSINDATTIEAEPVRHGRWIWDDEGYHCSGCLYHAQSNTLECMDGTFMFCPTCGAKMEVVDDETN